MQLTKYEEDSLNRLLKTIDEGKWTNDGLVQLIEVLGAHLNLMTVPDYAIENNISDKGARIETRTRKLRKIFNVTFVIEND